MEKILITGASGFIGKKLAAKLADLGRKVKAGYHSSYPKELGENPNIEICQLDILKQNEVGKAMENCNQVYHLAAYANTTTNNEVYYKINVDGTVNVLQAALKQNVKRVVLVSTAGTIGPQTSSLPVSEQTERKVPFYNEYEHTKFLAEVSAHKFAEKGLDVVIANPTRVFGPGELSKSNSVTLLIKEYVRNGFRFVPGEGSSVGNYVYVDDVINGLLLVMEKGNTNEKYILGGENCSFDEFFNILAEVSGVKKELVHLPEWLLLVVAYGYSGFSGISGKPPMITPSWVKRYLVNWTTSSAKAVHQLGYEITPLKIGVQKTINWLDEVG